MRSIIFVSIIITCISCAGTKNTAMKTAKLNGSWVPLNQEIGGKPLPKGLVAGQKLVINDTNYIFIAESTDKGILKFNNNKIDIYGKEGVNAGKHFTAIYKLENGELTICYNLLGDKYPEAFDTKGQPMYFMSVFKKEM